METIWVIFKSMGHMPIAAYDSESRARAQAALFERNGGDKYVVKPTTYTWDDRAGLWPSADDATSATETATVS